MKRLFLLVLAACASNAPSTPTPPAPVPPGSSAPAEIVVVDAGAPAPVASAPPVEPPPTYPTAPSDSDALIIQRTACNGKCPMYSVGVTSNGNVHFYGERFTKKLGYAFKTIPRDKVTALYKFLDTHPAPASKHPSAPDRAGAFGLVHRKGQTKRLEPGPIIDEVDRVVETAEWVQTDDFKYDEGPAIPAAAALAMLGRQLDALDKCSKGKSELSLTMAIGELGAPVVSSTAGKKEADSECISKALKGFRFPLGAAPVAPLALTIGK